MVARVNDAIAELKANPPPVPVADIAEAIQFLEWLNANNFTLLGVQDYTLAAEDLEPVPGHRARPAAPAATCRSCGAAARSSPSRRKSAPSSTSRRRSSSPRPTSSRGCIAASTWTTSASSASTPPASSPANSASSDCSPPAPTRGRRAAFPYLRRKIDAIVRRAGFDPDGHSGKALVNVLETYPARRAVPDRRGYALPLRARDHADRGAAARARAGAARPLRSLRLRAGFRAARALRHARAPGDRRISRRGLQRAGQRVLSVVPGRPAGPRALHHRSRRRRDAEPGSRNAGSGHLCDCADLVGRARRRACRRPRGGTRPCAVRALSQRLLGGLSRGLFAAPMRWPTSA